MISSGSMILTDTSGVTKAIDALDIGDEVVSSMTGQTSRISSIRSYVISVEGAQTFQNAIAPVLIKKHSLSSVVPEKDIILSSNQEVLIALDREGSSYKVVSDLLAAELKDYGFQTDAVTKDSVTFFDIEVEQGSHVIADSVLCKVMTGAPVSQTAKISGSAL